MSLPATAAPNTKVWLGKILGLVNASRDLVLIASFLLCNVALLLHLVDLLRSKTAEDSVAAVLIYLGPIVLGLGASILFARRDQLPLGALLAGATFLGASSISDLSASPRWLHLLVLTVAVFLMLTYLRVGVAWYALLVAAAAILVGWYVGDATIGLGSFACFAALVFVANYLVQLVLDHRHERRRLIRRPKELDSGKVAWLTFLFWVPSAALIMIGVLVNSIIQSEIADAIYDARLVEIAPADHKSTRTGMERDVYFTIDKREKNSLHEYSEAVKTAAAKGDRQLAAIPGDLAKALDALRPPDVNEGSVCANAVIRIKRIKAVSFRGICSGIIQSIEGMVMTTFQRARDAAVNKVQTETGKLREQGKLTEAEALRLGDEAIREASEDQRRLAGAIFALLLVLSLMSYAILVGALIGGFNLVLGRLAFDPNSLRKKNAEPIAFRLDPQDGNAKALAYTYHDDVNLSALTDTSGEKTWFVCFQATRIGTGTHMRLCVPQPFALSFQRLFRGRLLMSRVDIRESDELDADNPRNDATRDQSAGTILQSSHRPVISAPGDLKLVCIFLDGRQEIVFHVGELLAFTGNVRLQSVYTAHIGAHLLGLGSFYSIASGIGYLVLLSEGARVRAVPNELSVPPETLLAWDRRTQFALAQEGTFAGIWFNDPSVIQGSVGGGAIMDEGRAPAPGLWNRLWRLVRYLFMPF